MFSMMIFGRPGMYFSRNGIKERACMSPEPPGRPPRRMVIVFSLEIMTLGERSAIGTKECGDQDKDEK
jgi:hypothetical protein